MNRIQAQAKQLWQLLTTPTTAKTYQQAWVLTIQILKETGLLLWLVICLSLVFFDWFWKFGVQSGRNFRSWLNNMESTSPENIVSGGGSALVTLGKNSLNAVLSQARQQLGLSTAEGSSTAPKASSTSTETK
ncbi:MAG TPA: hypothetical protein IGS37_03285 [Synechococcales cyanobacterium M55_K2018_004]|nr:hypothetical protein [Synechococcales cyanobacterium M55_K2018_004]